MSDGHVPTKEFKLNTTRKKNSPIGFKVMFPAGFCVRWADGYEQRNLSHGSKPSLIQAHSSNRMSHDMFADCDLSPLCPAHSFTAIPLLSEPTQHEVS